MTLLWSWSARLIRNAMLAGFKSSRGNQFAFLLPFPEFAQMLFRAVKDFLHCLVARSSIGGTLNMGVVVEARLTLRRER